MWVHDQAALVRDERGVVASRTACCSTSRAQARRRAGRVPRLPRRADRPARASMFEELLELSIARARRHDGSVAVVCVDLDDFRSSTTRSGTTRGDELLSVVADRLREATRETDLVARRGGDQFLLLLADLERDERGDMDAAVIRAESVAQRIHESLPRPFSVGGHRALHLRQRRHQPVPAGRRGCRRAPAQRRGRDVRGEEVRAARLRRLVRRRRRTPARSCSS